MNECPACGASSKEQYSFCRSCGAALKLPETERVFRTECGTRVKASQGVCHSCRQPLSPEGLEYSPPAAAGHRVAVNARRARSWVIALLGGSVLAVLLVAWWLFLSKTPPRFSVVPPIPLESELKSSTIESQPTTAQPSPVPANSGQVSPKQESLPTNEVLKKELEELLQNMRAAQLKKDIDQYLNYYATNFPALDKKRQITVKNWELYDYLDLEYKIDEVKLLITGNASALVTWNIKYRNKGSEEIKYIIQKFNILLSNESGKWRISKLELITKP
jgi:hypothetical protein